MTAPRSEPIRIARIIARLNIGGPAIQAITLTQRLESLGDLLRGGPVCRLEGQAVLDQLAHRDRHRVRERHRPVQAGSNTVTGRASSPSRT